MLPSRSLPRSPGSGLPPKPFGWLGSLVPVYAILMISFGKVMMYKYGSSDEPLNKWLS